MTLGITVILRPKTQSVLPFGRVMAILVFLGHTFGQWAEKDTFIIKDENLRSLFNIPPIIIAKWSQIFISDDESVIFSCLIL
jgi:hypothetical protein